MERRESKPVKDLAILCIAFFLVGYYESFKWTGKKEGKPPILFPFLGVVSSLTLATWVLISIK